jgi:uncharacterized protein (UPF0276 family)
MYRVPEGPSGVGLGFRLGMASAMLSAVDPPWSFIEIAPENYVNVGGRRARLLREAATRWPIVFHGLCGDLAGLAPMDDDYWNALRGFLREHGATWYSDHLCLTHIGGAEIHELVPMPFNGESVRRSARRIREVSERLELPVAVENISAYARMPEGDMEEAAFVRAVLEEADAPLLLDVNNVHVNAVNFGFDPLEFIRALPLERVVEIHVAGYDVEAPDLLLDTHATPIADPVYDLFDKTLRLIPHRPPVLLERDGNFPPLAELEDELRRLRRIMDAVDEAA